MTEETQIDMSDLLTRDGHLGELTVNRQLTGELDAEASAMVAKHLAQCAACSARVEAVQGFDAQFSIAPPAPNNVVSLAAERSKRTTGIAIVAMLAAAAAVALALNVGGSDKARVAPGVDDIRFKGSGLALEVFAKSGDRPARLVGNGDVVSPGDRLGFKVTSREDGFLMIVGVDDGGQVYGGWPQQSGGNAEFTPGGDAPRDLESAIRLDEVGSQEKLVLVRCEQTFDIAAVTKHLSGAKSLQKQPARDPLAGCVYDDVTLKKKPR